MNISLCQCACACNRKLITFTSISLGRCVDCRLGNCKGASIPTLLTLSKPIADDKNDKKEN